MKKTTILLMAFVGLIGAASAQDVKQVAAVPARLCKSNEIPKSNSPEKAHNTHKVAAASFYTQDFAGGIPAGWTNNGVPSTAMWEGRTMAGADTLGSRGAYSPKRRLISPTVNNGFMIFDSDYLANGGIPGDSAGMSPVPHKGVLTSNSIDCSFHGSVLLHFNQYFHRFAARTFIKVSNGTKNALYEVNIGSPTVNGATPFTSKITLNISDIAVNQPNVTISFIFDGTVDYPGAYNSTGYYEWQIDDVSLSEADQGDLAMEEGSISNYYSAGFTTQVPVNQYKQGFKFSSEIYSLSPVPATDVTVIATFKDAGGNTIATSSSLSKPLKPFQRDTLSWDDPLVTLPPAAGIYTVQLSVQSATPDPNPLNNTGIQYTLALTDSVFARDNSTVSQYLSTNNYADPTAEGASIANQYTLKESQKVKSISVYLAPGTTPGSRFDVRILNANMRFIVASDIYTIVASDINNFATVYFDPSNTETNLAPGTYYASVFCYKQDQTITPTQKIIFGDDQTILQPVETSKLNIDGLWYPAGIAWLLRMGMVPNTVGIASIASKDGLSLSQNTPNPFNGISTINYSIESAGKVSLEVTDVTGRKVTEINEGIKAPGSYQVALNAADFNKGIYFYTLRVGATSLTKKMVVTFQ